MVKILGISGIGGAGKSSLTHALSKELKATPLFWDDFDEISEYPKDYIEWYNRSRDYSEWKYDALAEVLKNLKLRKEIVHPTKHNILIPTNYVVFDAPLGRKHKVTGQYIDISIFLETPLDVALARRILRDFKNKKNVNANEILENLNFYLSSSRRLYLMHYETNEIFDLVLDGSLPVENLVATIFKKINAYELQG